ncbi:hypothetical protein VKT23_009186 [Stygiomarasmius scandens]|uniref:Uncharacterized protein n=1 Tax=Marasmiellus scandens TaxID=2682957 RepID=A0ABR1JFN8_9AGAR
MTGDNNKDALRVALGSILTPKRPSPSRSNTSSGTATPLHGYPHSHYPHIHPYPHTHSHPHHPAGAHGHSHAPSRLGPGTDSHQLPSPIYESPPPLHQPNFGLPPRLSRNSSHGHIPTLSHTHSHSHHALDHAPAQPHGAPALTIEAPSPISAAASSTSVHEHGLPTPPRSNGGSGAGTPTSRGKFLEKLEGKTQSAWDALIHGSFS